MYEDIQDLCVSLFSGGIPFVSLSINIFLGSNIAKTHIITAVGLLGITQASKIYVRAWAKYIQGLDSYHPCNYPSGSL